MKGALQVDFIITICYWFGPFYSHKILSEPPTAHGRRFRQYYKILLHTPRLFQGMAMVGGGVLGGSVTNLIILFGGIKGFLHTDRVTTPIAGKVT